MDICKVNEDKEEKEDMTPGLFALFIGTGLAILLYWLRQPGNGGIVGRRVRNSDHRALQDAIAEKRHELEQLQTLRSKYPGEG